MKALRKTEPSFGLQLLDIAPPGPPGPGEVVVAVEAAGICGSDVHIYDWSGGYEFIVPAMPVTLGHELAGRVAAAAAEEIGSASCRERVQISVTDVSLNQKYAVSPNYVHPR